MKRLMVVSLGVSCVGLGVLTACSWQGAAMSGAQMGMNLSKEDAFLRISLDGQEAEQNKLKKAATGYSNWKIDGGVSTSPKLRFRITKPEKLGRITTVIASVYQQFEADYSHQADYTIVPRDNSSEAQMRPDADYDLSNPGGAFKIIDVRGNEIPRIEMTPGKKYKLVLTVRADRSETAAIEFKTS